MALPKYDIQDRGGEMNKTDWISVKDRLPEVENEKDPELGWLVTNGRYMWLEESHPTYWIDELEYHITHWMLLPELP